VTAGLTGGLIWGLAFPIPVLLQAWSPSAITAGRYLAYGLVSGALFVAAGQGIRRLAREHWWTAFQFAIAGNIGYYLLLVIGIATVGAPATDLVIGAIPIVLALAGNLVAPAYAWRRLILPVALVAVGLVLINGLEIAGSRSYNPAPTPIKLAGLVAAFGAVAIWSWYALANARFLTSHPEVSGAAWSTIVGVATGTLTLAALPLLWLTGQLTPSNRGASLLGLIAGTAILGILVSWVGTWLWNAASSRLPPSLAGQLINVETVSGFAYVYAIRLEWPPVGQLIGFALVILGLLAAPYRQQPLKERAS
jgi:drug/metabolite transporter (DMT)-like permease